MQKIAFVELQASFKIIFIQYYAYSDFKKMFMDVFLLSAQWRNESWASSFDTR